MFGIKIKRNNSWVWEISPRYSSEEEALRIARMLFGLAKIEIKVEKI